jgi:hypothetical protein
MSQRSASGAVDPAARTALPLVSVVMIFKNAAPFLMQAAQSVLGQTWPAVELVLIDDGGTDGSVLIAEEVRASSPELVRLISHEGRESRGTGPSRLLGIEHARGELTAFLDADDVWGPEHIAHDVHLLLRHPGADVVCGRSLIWRSWSGGDDELNPLPFAPGTVISPPRMLRAVLRNGTIAVPTCSLLVRTQRLSTVEDDLAAFRATYEDQVINTLLHLRATAVISGATDAWYRQHPDSLTAKAKRTGQDADSGASPARREFLAWLTSLPDLAPARADPELRALVEAELAIQFAPVTPVRPGVLRGAARRAVPAPARALLRSLADRRTSAAEHALPRPGLAFLTRWTEDVCGMVAVVGDRVADLVAGPRVTSLHVLQRAMWAAALASLPLLDCLVITGPLLRDEVALAARHLLPSGSLLAVGNAVDGGEAVRRGLSEVVGAQCVHVDEHVPRRGSAPRLLTVRALRPA